MGRRDDCVGEWGHTSQLTIGRRHRFVSCRRVAEIFVLLGSAPCQYCHGVRTQRTAVYTPPFCCRYIWNTSQTYCAEHCPTWQCDSCAVTRENPWNLISNIETVEYIIFCCPYCACKVTKITQTRAQVTNKRILVQNIIYNPTYLILYILPCSCFLNAFITHKLQHFVYIISNMFRLHYTIIIIESILDNKLFVVRYIMVIP
jgi:hypothetical protein